MKINVNDILLKKFSAESENIIEKTKHIKKNKKVTDEKLKKVCEDFESYFVNYMLKEMRKTVPKYDLVEESNAKKIYDSMLYEHLSENISHAGGIGIANLLYEHLKS